MATRVVDNLLIENARLIFRNFAGEETQFNRKGNRNFGVIIEDPKMAEKLSNDGWNVKELRPRDDQDEIRHWIPVSVNFDSFSPPKIFMLTGKTRTELDDETAGELDHAILKNVDLTLRPYNWEVNGKTGVKAYLKNLYATIEEDELDKKYRDFGDSFKAEPVVADDDDDLPF